MKITHVALTLGFSCTSLFFHATEVIAAESYNYVSAGTSPISIGANNDGRHTTIEAVSGLVVRGATVDGGRLIIEGAPTKLTVQMHGKPVTLFKTASQRTDAISTDKDKEDASNAYVDALQLRLSSLESTLHAKEASFHALQSDLNAEATRISTSQSYTNVQDAVSALVPKNFTISINADVKQTVQLDINPSQYWMDALGDGLQKVGIELTTNLYNKTVTLASHRTALSIFLEKSLPDDYTVFTDADINLATLVRSDPTMLWPEALTKAANDAGVAATVSLSQKIIVLKSTQTQ